MSTYAGHLSAELVKAATDIWANDGNEGRVYAGIACHLIENGYESIKLTQVGHLIRRKPALWSAWAAVTYAADGTSKRLPMKEFMLRSPFFALEEVGHDPLVSLLTEQVLSAAEARRGSSGGAAAAALPPAAAAAAAATATAAAASAATSAYSYERYDTALVSLYGSDSLEDRLKLMLGCRLAEESMGGSGRNTGGWLYFSQVGEFFLRQDKELWTQYRSRSGSHNVGSLLSGDDMFQVVYDDTITNYRVRLRRNKLLGSAKGATLPRAAASPAPAPSHADLAALIRPAAVDAAFPGGSIQALVKRVVTTALLTRPGARMTVAQAGQALATNKEVKAKSAELLASGSARPPVFKLRAVLMSDPVFAVVETGIQGAEVVELDMAQLTRRGALGAGAGAGPVAAAGGAPAAQPGSDMPAGGADQAAGAAGADGSATATPSYPYALRPEKRTCTYFVKHGWCAHGAKCWYNHPPERTTRGPGGKVLAPGLLAAMQAAGAAELGALVETAARLGEPSPPSAAASTTTPAPPVAPITPTAAAVRHAPAAPAEAPAAAPQPPRLIDMVLVEGPGPALQRMRAHLLACTRIAVSAHIGQPSRPPGSPSAQPQLCALSFFAPDASVTVSSQPAYGSAPPQPPPQHAPAAMYLVDLLAAAAQAAAGGLAPLLSVVKEVMERRGLSKVFHDVRPAAGLLGAAGIQVVGVVDTQVLAGLTALMAAGGPEAAATATAPVADAELLQRCSLDVLMARHKLSHPSASVGQLAGVAPAALASAWCVRPLTPVLREASAASVRFLLPLSFKLLKELVDGAAGLGRWISGSRAALAAKGGLAAASAAGTATIVAASGTKPAWRLVADASQPRHACYSLLSKLDADAVRAAQPLPLPPLSPVMSPLLQALPPALADAVAQLSAAAIGNPGAALQEVCVDEGSPVVVRLADGGRRQLSLRVPVAEVVRCISAYVKQQQASCAGGGIPVPVAVPAGNGGAATAADVFGPNGRLYLPGSLDQVSALLNGHGFVTGLTIRLKRHVHTASLVAPDLLSALSDCSAPPGGNTALGSSGNTSLLVLGGPGAGKTCWLRSAAALLSEAGRHVVVLDTWGALAGHGTLPAPHLTASGVRVVCVPDRSKQAALLPEVVSQHGPQVLVIDEVANSTEAKALRAVSQRGVVVLCGCPAADLASLMADPELVALVGGVPLMNPGLQGDSSKTPLALKRAYAPAFGGCIELLPPSSAGRAPLNRLHPDLADSVDKLLAGAAGRGGAGKPDTQLRRLAAGATVADAVVCVEFETPDAAARALPAEQAAAAAAAVRAATTGATNVRAATADGAEEAVMQLSGCVQSAADGLPGKWLADVFTYGVLNAAASNQSS